MLLCGLQKEGIQIENYYCLQYFVGNCKYQLGCHGSCDDTYGYATGLILFLTEKGSEVQ